MNNDQLGAAQDDVRKSHQYQTRDLIDKDDGMAFTKEDLEGGDAENEEVDQVKEAVDGQFTEALTFEVNENKEENKSE